MTHRTRPARKPLTLGLAAFALLSVCAFAPRPHASQTPAPPAPPPAALSADGNPVTREQLLHALRSREYDEAALVRLVEGRGSLFLPTAEDEKELRAAGATDHLLEAVRTNYGPRVVLRPSAGGGGGMLNPNPAHIDYKNPFGRNEGYTRPFRQNEVTKRALVTEKPEPGFTEEARKNSVEGVVRLRATLAASGGVQDISVVKGLPDGLTEKALAAARRIKFTPAEKDGRRVSQYVVLEYNFNIYYDEDDVEERAVILVKPPAEYTEEARRNGVRGKVVLKVALMSHGTVSLVSVERGLPHGLRQAALDAVYLIKFKPARFKGRAVSQLTTVEYTFPP